MTPHHLSIAHENRSNHRRFPGCGEGNSNVSSRTHSVSTRLFYWNSGSLWGARHRGRPPLPTGLAPVQLDAS